MSHLSWHSGLRWILAASFLALMVAQLGGAGPVFTQTLFLLPDRLFDSLLFNQNLLAIPLFVLLDALVQATVCRRLESFRPDQQHIKYLR